MSSTPLTRAACRIGSSWRSTFGRKPALAVLCAPRVASTTSCERQSEEREPLLADVDLILGQLTADRDHLRDAGDREQAVPEVELGVGPELEIADRAARRREREQHDLAGDRRDRRDLRVCVLGQHLAHGGEALRHELPRAVDVRRPVELDPDERKADRARAADAADARQPVHGRLDRERDVLLDLVRREPARLGQHDDGRRVELGEDVDRHVGNEVSGEHDEDARQHHDERCVLEGELDDFLEHRDFRCLLVFALVERAVRVEVAALGGAGATSRA